jgi:predicted DNA-binding transcriptional regulator
VNHSEQLLSEVKDKTAFMRKGKIGSYKDEMPEEYIKKFDEFIQKSLENVDHRFNLV